MKYSIKVFGCQYNEWDAARLDYVLQTLGLTPSSEKQADIIFIIACSVRQTAVDRIFGLINNLKNKKIIITGCALPPDQKKFIQKGAIFWPTNQPEKLAEILKIKNKTSVKYLQKIGSATSAFIPIMVGCNNFCTYCAVPYTRGRETSRPFNDIVSDFKTLIKKDEKEIWLLGQNVNSFKIQTSKFKPQNYHSKFKTDFAILLDILNQIPGEFVIKFTSNHPKDMSDEIISAVATLPKVVKQIHLPLQSGSDKILKAMNRPYSIKQYLDLVKKIKAKIPNVILTTDVIVGFPGETEADFQKTVAVFKLVKYHIAYINKYSPRAGTAAFSLGDPISWAEKQRRWRILNNITNNK